MNIFDIDKLNKDSNGIYDLSQLTFQSRIDITLYEYTVQRGEEMRIDLVCESIYGSDEHVDIIMHINNIDNPLNIKEGSTINYPSSTDIESYRITEEKKNTVQNSIVNANKTTRKDSSRDNYIKQGYSLPPVVLPAPSDPVKINGNSITIGGSNF